MNRQEHAFALALAGNERRRAATMSPGADRADALGWARDLLTAAREWRVELGNGEA